MFNWNLMAGNENRPTYGNGKWDILFADGKRIMAWQDLKGRVRWQQVPAGLR